MKPGSILFLCGQNAIRSPMAEAIARARLPREIYIASAGIRHGKRDAFIGAILEEEGLAPIDRDPVRLADMEDVYFDLIVTLAPDAHHAALELTRTMAVDVEYWPMPDPSATSGTRSQILLAYRALYQRLSQHIETRLVRAGKIR